jgi:hypothetical protein
VPSVTGRSHSACDSIRFLAIDAWRIHPLFHQPGAGPNLFMDEVDGRPGHVALQFGHLDAPQDAPKPSSVPPPSLVNQWSQLTVKWSADRRLSLPFSKCISWQTQMATMGHPAVSPSRASPFHLYFAPTSGAKLPSGS